MQRRKTFFRFPSLSLKSSSTEAAEAPAAEFEPHHAPKPPEKAPPSGAPPSASGPSDKSGFLPVLSPPARLDSAGRSTEPADASSELPSGLQDGLHQADECADCRESLRPEKPSDPFLPSPSPHRCPPPPPSCLTPPSPLTCLTPPSPPSPSSSRGPSAFAAVDEASGGREAREAAQKQASPLADAPRALEPIEEGKVAVARASPLAEAPQAERDAAFGAPKVLGGYEVLGEIARKKKSSLWLCRRRAEAPRLLGRVEDAHGDSEPSELFAVKEVQKASVVTQKQAEHLWNERRVLEEAAFFPEVQCSVHRLVETFKSDSALFFVFEAVLGGPLHRHIRFEGGFPVDRVRWYAAELVLILEALHRRGILYRDLQASNILLADDGRLKLVDFGLAKNLERPEPSAIPPCAASTLAAPASSSQSSASASALSSSELKRTFSYCGTLHAMAPEVIAEGRRAAACAPPAQGSSKKWRGCGLFEAGASRSHSREQEKSLSKSASSFAPVGGKHRLFPRLAEPRSRSRSSEPNRRTAEHGPQADEQGSPRGYSFPADWWALGVVIFEMLYNAVPFGYHDYENERSRPICELVKSSPSTVIFPRDRRVPDEAKDLILRLLQVGNSGDFRRTACTREASWTSRRRGGEESLVFSDGRLGNSRQHSPGAERPPNPAALHSGSRARPRLDAFHRRKKGETKSRRRSVCGFLRGNSVPRVFGRRRIRMCGDSATRRPLSVAVARLSLTSLFQGIHTLCLVSFFVSSLCWLLLFFLPFRFCLSLELVTFRFRRTARRSPSSPQFLSPRPRVQTPRIPRGAPQLAAEVHAQWSRAVPVGDLLCGSLKASSEASF